MTLSSRRLLAIAAGCCVSMASSCTNGGPGTLPSSPAEIDPRFVDDVKQAFSAYKAWGRVDDELRWAPFLCRMPQPGRPVMSAADGEGGHAKKLYSLFARDRAAYVSLGTTEAKQAHVAQTVAKESYVPEVVESAPPEPTPGTTSPEADHFHPFAKAPDGKTYRASTLAGVYFLIEKPGVPGTDDGVVYGTATASGEVTSAGRVSSCMGCHVEAKHGRFFGAPAHP